MQRNVKHMKQPANPASRSRLKEDIAEAHERGLWPRSSSLIGEETLKSEYRISK